MLLQSPRALCLAPGGYGRILKYLEAPVKSSGVSGRIVCYFRTDLHLADALKVLEHMHTVSLTGKTDDEIMNIITNAGRTAEKWEEGRKNLGLRKPILEVLTETQSRCQLEQETCFDKPGKFKKKFQGRMNNWNNQSGGKFKPRNKSSKTYAVQTEGMDKSELDRRKAAGEC